MASAVHVNWFPLLVRKTFPKVKCYYQRYPFIVDDNAGQPADAPASVADDVDDVFAQEALREGDLGYSFTAGDHSIIATALARLFKIVPIPIFFADYYEG